MKSRLAESTGPVPAAPPENHEAECALLGCVILDAPAGIRQLEQAGVNAQCFHDHSHRKLFQAIREMFAGGGEVTVLTLHLKLKQEGWYQEAGGLPWLDGFASVAVSPCNLVYYLPEVMDAYSRRLAFTAATRLLQASAHDGASARDALECAETVFNSLREQSGLSGLPPIMDAVDLLADTTPVPTELVSGLLHQGSKLMLGGGSKTHKTWVLLDLAVAVACGEPWLSCKTTRGRVLYVNFEISKTFFRERTRTVARAHGVDLQPGWLDTWNLRGHAAGFDTLLPRIAMAVRSGGYVLIILDPLYKLYGDTDENSARDVARLLNGIERLAQESGAAVVFGAHFSKGNQAAKESIDRVSGSGVFGRDADSILMFTKHETEGAFTVEPTVRNLEPVAPFVVEWHYPMFRRNEELDPVKLKQAAGRKVEYSVMDLIDLLGTKRMKASQWHGLARSDNGISKSRFFDLLRKAESEGLVAKLADGKWFAKAEAFV